MPGLANVPAHVPGMLQTLMLSSRIESIETPEMLKTKQMGQPVLHTAQCSASTVYPIQKITEIYNKITEMYKKVTDLEISCWNVLFRLRSEVSYIGTGPILP